MMVPPTELGREAFGEGEEGSGVLIFNDECLGGEGGLVELECIDLVNNLETLAVAVDVEASANGGGVISVGGGWILENEGGGGCLSKILCSAETVCLALHPPSDEEEEDSSIGGVMRRRGGVAGGFGVLDRERRSPPPPPSNEGDARSLLELFRLNELRGEPNTDEDGVLDPELADLTNDESILYAFVVLDSPPYPIRSVKTGLEIPACKLEADLRPMVDGSIIVSASIEDEAATYCVNARGGGEIKFRRSCGSNRRWEAVEVWGCCRGCCRGSNDVLRRCLCRCIGLVLGRLQLTAGEEAEGGSSSSSSANNRSTLRPIASHRLLYWSKSQFRVCDDDSVSVVEPPVIEAMTDCVDIEDCNKVFDISNA